MSARIVQSPQSRRVGLGLIAALYALLVVLYAVNVPRWNAPDEPAHFNYIRHLAERSEFPILVAADYNFDYLERIKAAHFPPDMSIDAIRYEAHQPPLYYLLGAAVFRLSAPVGFDGQVLALRLFSGLLGLLLLLVGYATVRRIFPAEHWLALAVTAFLAFIPMHVAVDAAIGNDPLANLIMAAIIWESVGILRPPPLEPGHDRSVPPRASQGAGSNIPSRPWHVAALRLLASPNLRLGLWLGMALLTKTTAYAGIPLAAVAIVVAARREGDAWRGLRRLAAVGALALLISGWWFARNAFVYGPGDLFGLQRHNEIMVAGGQPLTGAVDARVLGEFAVGTFRSFWGQFGWMGVPMDERVYAALAVLSLAALLGLALYVLSLARGPRPLAPTQVTALQLLLLAALLVAAAFGQYNLTFFQAQGRYLFPALPAIAIGFVLGLRELAAPRRAPLLLTLLLLGLVALDFLALYRYILPQLRT